MPSSPFKVSHNIFISLTVPLMINIVNTVLEICGKIRIKEDK